MKKKANITVKTFAIKYIYLFIIGIVMSFTTSAITIVANDLIAKVMDKVMSGQTVEIKGTVILVLSLAAAIGIATFLNVFFIRKYGLNVQTAFKNAAAKRLPDIEYRYLDEKGSGEILNHLISDIREMDLLFSSSLPEISTSIIVLTVTIGYMFVMDWRLAVVIIIIYPILLFLTNIISNKVKKLAQLRRSKLDERTEIAYDSVSGVVVSKSYNLEGALDDRIGNVIEQVFKNERARTSISSLSYVLEATIGWFPVIVCYVIALFEVLSCVITAGEMLAFSVLLGFVSRHAEIIPSLWIEFKECMVSVARLDKLMAAPLEKSGDYKGSIDDSNNAIELTDLCFSYSDNEEFQVLKGVSLTVRKGSKCAIIGSSGGGKSTVFKVLTGYYSDIKGSYKLFGKEFREWDINSARALFSLVSQNVFLLPESIYANVLYGNLSATRQQVIEACKNANIHEFIENLPNGYDTEVGERGVRLSGGERQRISIARAFIKNAPILLLDEPTAAIDVGTENAIQKVIDRISQGKTVITIAHRLNTVIDSDEIFVLDGGVIAERGSHDELLAQKGVYANLYGKQKEAQEKDKEAMKDGE